MAFSAHGITALILFHKSDRFKTAIIILCFRPKHSRTSYNVYAISACFSFWQIHTLSFTIMGFIIITSTTFHFPYPSFSCTTAGSLILSAQSGAFCQHIISYTHPASPFPPKCNSRIRRSVEGLLLSLPCNPAVSGGKVLGSSPIFPVFLLQSSAYFLDSTFLWSPLLFPHVLCFTSGSWH